MRPSWIFRNCNRINIGLLVILFSYFFCIISPNKNVHSVTVHLMFSVVCVYKILKDFQQPHLFFCVFLVLHGSIIAFFICSFGSWISELSESVSDSLLTAGFVTVAVAIKHRSQHIYVMSNNSSGWFDRRWHSSWYDVCHWYVWLFSNKGQLILKRISPSPTVTPRKLLLRLRKSRIPLEEIAFWGQKLKMEVRCHKISY